MQALEITRDETGTITATIFDINTELGYATIDHIFQTGDPTNIGALEELFTLFCPYCQLVKVDVTTPGAKPCGNHWVLKADILGTWEIAELMAN